MNAIGNVVATIVLARNEGELDEARMRLVLAGELVEDYPIGGKARGFAP